MKHYLFEFGICLRAILCDIAPFCLQLHRIESHVILCILLRTNHEIIYYIGVQ